MTEVRVRGIYATALTELFENIVQASPAIEERFDSDFPVAPASATVETTRDRQGVGVYGAPETVERVVSKLAEIAVDTFVWDATLPRGGVYAGEVIETLGSGALVDCGSGTGFLPYSKTSRRIEDGDRLRVQVADPRPPWENRRPGLDTTVRMYGELVTLVRGGDTGTDGAPELAEILPSDPPAGWGVNWSRTADDAGLDALSDALEQCGTRAQAMDEALSDAPAPGEAAPHTYWEGDTTRWVWFGRESRFELDTRRRDITATMPGHHRIKAGANSASTAVDFVEAVCGSLTDEDADGEPFPFGAVTAQFGPHVGDSIRIGHGKPDGRRLELGSGEVTARDGSQVTVERELSGGGRYDALGTRKRSGDIATTTFREGRWWYPTVYRGADGESRGTYVNICTPVEIFPEEIRYVDLHVDVIRTPDGTVERVDTVELADAVSEGLVSETLAEKAQTVAAAVENALS